MPLIDRIDVPEAGPELDAALHEWAPKRSWESLVFVPRYSTHDGDATKLLQALDKLRVAYRVETGDVSVPDGFVLPETGQQTSRQWRVTLPGICEGQSYTGLAHAVASAVFAYLKDGKPLY